MIKVASKNELGLVRDIMDRIHREEPSYWPYGLSTDQFNGGLYLVKESTEAAPVGFVGWQQFPEGGRNVGYYAVGILPEYRQRGFAKSAVAQVIREVWEHCDDVKAMIASHNLPSKALARSLNVEVIEKVAKLSDKAMGRLAMLAGGLGSAAFYDQTANPDRTLGDTLQFWNWDKRRGLMGGLNAILGGLGGQQMHAGQFGKGLAALAIAPGKDLMLKGIDTLHKVDSAASESAKSLIAAREQPAAKNLFESIPKGVLLGAGGLGLGALALSLYNSKRKRDLEEQALAQARSGTASVTLPTRRPGDVETKIQIPVGDLQISNALMHNLGRDTRRRLREETKGRTVRRGDQHDPTDGEKSAAFYLRCFVADLRKSAAAAAPAGSVPTPPQTGQNPALRMQQQSQATAQSITPPPAANPAVMEAEQKAMAAEQSATQQAAQVEQAAQQSQMEQQQQFQQALAQSEQEKQVLQLQLEKEKAVASLQKEQAKAHADLSKRQADGAASASMGENSVAGRLLTNRLSRLQKRVGGGSKSASVLSEGQLPGVLRIPAVDPVTGLKASGPGVIDAKPTSTLRHLKPNSGQRLNNNPGANLSFPAPTIARASYGPLLDSAFDWTLKKVLMSPNTNAPRMVSSADLINAPDRIGMISQLYSNAITANPMS